MDSIHLKVAQIGVEQANVPSDDTNASFVLRLGKIARRAVRKPRTESSLVLELRFDAGYFSIEALLSVSLTQRPKSNANPYAAMFLVDGELPLVSTVMPCERVAAVMFLRTWDAAALSEGSGAGAKVKWAAESFWR
jgi:hypothetical protein